jgi:Mn-dependent DtxR family transcriptional regulator
MARPVRAKTDRRVLKVLKLLKASEEGLLARQIAVALNISPREAGHACRMLRARGLVVAVGRDRCAWVRLWKRADRKEAM